MFMDSESQVIGGSMKKVLVIGCSNGLSLTETLPKVFPKIQVTNYSGSGFGNEYMAGRLFECIENETRPDFVYLQFSGLLRVDIPFDRKLKIHDEYATVIKTNSNTWVGSGGQHGSWGNYEFTKKHFAGRIEIFDKSAKAQKLNSLKFIFAATELCRTLDIPYAWTSYYNYLSPPSEWIKDNDGGIEKYPDWINLDKHLGGHPLDFAISQNQPPKDGVHYSERMEYIFLEHHKGKFDL